MPLAKRSRPKHSRLVDQLHALVEETRARGETCLPSERELGERFGVSRVTVRNALAVLEEQGLIYRVQGKGAFISKEKFHQPLSALTSFTEDMDSQGMVSGAKILALESVPATQKIARMLSLPPDSQVIMLRRLRSINGEPIAIENCYLPPAIGEKILHNLQDNGSLYALMQSLCGVSPVWAEQSFEAGGLFPWEQSLFGEKAPPYAMCTTRLTFDQNDSPIEYVESKYRADRYAYHVRMEAKHAYGEYRPQ